MRDENRRLIVSIAVFVGALMLGWLLLPSRPVATPTTDDLVFLKSKVATLEAANDALYVRGGSIDRLCRRVVSLETAVESLQQEATELRRQRQVKASQEGR